ncbi:MAG: metallophosphoesterase [Alphaproteobacteria bacterium]|nr:metallophosphoesterase [Alphaproteobacteria bacterium]
MDGHFSIAVMSDLHVHNSPASPPSHIGIADPEDHATRHPITGLKKLITDEKLTCDIVMCAGDATDKAEPACLKYAWQKLHDLKILLGAKHVIATAGNHDLDSRYNHNDFDAKGHLQALTPAFPGLSEIECDKYWARNYAICELPNVRILCLNSAAYHGSGKTQSEELERGRISANTLASIECALQSTSPAKISLLLCHHHLYRDNSVSDADYSEMDGADRLIALLGSGRFGQWLVIHGHKHRPKLCYAAGSGSAPVIFGAGSLAAMLYPHLAAQARNQFHLVTMPYSIFDELGIELAGTIASWDWVPLRGWQKAGKDSGLPHAAGFGYRPSFIKDIRRIKEIVDDRSLFVDWTVILSKMPELRYILPEDANRLARCLRENEIDYTCDDDGVIKQLSRRC